MQEETQNKIEVELEVRSINRHLSCSCWVLQMKKRAIFCSALLATAREMKCVDGKETGSIEQKRALSQWQNRRNKCHRFEGNKVVDFECLN